MGYIYIQVVTLCTALFARSVAFRALVAANAASFYERLLDAAGGSAGVTVSASAQLTAQVQAARAQNVQLQSVLAMLEAWKEDFGDRYPPLAAGHAALEQRGFVFPLLRQKRLRDAQHEAESRQLRTRIRQAQIDQMARAAPEIEDVVVEMNRIFDILVPTLDAFNLFDEMSPRVADTIGSGSGDREAGGKRRVPQAKIADASDNASDDEEDNVDWEDVPGDGEAGEAGSIEWEDVENAPAEHDDKCDQDDDDDDDDGDGDTYESDGEEESDGDTVTRSRLDMNQIVQAYGLGSSSYQLTIEIPTRTGMCAQSSDNEVLFRHLADGILRIRKRFLPLVNEWKQHIQQHDETSTSSCYNSTDDSALAYRVDDLQHRLELIVAKWEDLVEESEKKRFAKITPSVVSLPLSSYTPRSKRQTHTASRTDKRQRVLLQDKRRLRPKQ